ncbi:MarR family winged helix-turn-helix transcriptional regulator, partial [Bifidobacterium aquikefiri]|uniref:MarR family winged helix-turn-helix transcriptional regulator n=3 Tax=Bifidobacterium TaxID=1678 RepID=UPI0039E7973A
IYNSDDVSPSDIIPVNEGLRQPHAIRNATLAPGFEQLAPLTYYWYGKSRWSRLMTQTDTFNEFDILDDPRQLPRYMYICSKEIIKAYTPYLEPLNLTYTQYLTMIALWDAYDGEGDGGKGDDRKGHDRDKSHEGGAPNVKELGTTLYLDSGTLTPLLKKLEAEGFITRRRSKVDERSVNVELTAKGLALRAKTIGISGQILSRVGLTQSEAVTLFRLLRKSLSNLSE